jgi:hypothetical protein
MMLVILANCHSFVQMPYCVMLSTGISGNVDNITYTIRFFLFCFFTNVYIGEIYIYIRCRVLGLVTIYMKLRCNDCILRCRANWLTYGSVSQYELVDVWKRITV